MSGIGKAYGALLRTFGFLLVLCCAGQAAAQAWRQLAPIGEPPLPRVSHTAVYDAAGNNMIVFGGGSIVGDTVIGNLIDVWVLRHANGTGGTPTWMRLNPTGEPPTPRNGSTAVYAAGNTMIVFGGYGEGLWNDVWVLSHANGTGGTPAWTQLAPAGSLPARSQHTAVYDAAGNNMIVFGGASGLDLKDVWVLSHANGTGGTPAWKRLNTASGPPGRYFHTAVYDGAGNNMIVFGGNSFDIGYLNDVWVLSHANGSGGTPAWTQLNPVVGPAGRVLTTAVYDAVGNSMIVFDGESDGGTLNDAWMLSHANGNGGTPVWTQLSMVNSPPARYFHTAVYDTAGDRMIVFGGVNTRYLNDVWVLSGAEGNVSLPVGILIRPDLDANVIIFNSNGTVEVSILSTAILDATTEVDQTSLTFGHTGSEASLDNCNKHYNDVNGDGRRDLTCGFKIAKTGFQLGDTTGYLKGRTTVGTPIHGNDVVNVRK